MDLRDARLIRPTKTPTFARTWRRSVRQRMPAAVSSRAGWSIEQAARGLGVSVRTYRELEDGKRSPNFETWDRIHGCD